MGRNEYSPLLPSKQASQKYCRLSVVCIALFIFFFIAAFVLPWYAMHMLYNGVKDGIVINPAHGEVVADWADARRPNQPAKYHTYNIFNVSNIEDVVFRNATPRVEEIGPFTYREYAIQYNYTFSEGNTHLRFNTFSQYIYQPQLSTTASLPNETFVYTPWSTYVTAASQAGSEAALMIGISGHAAMATITLLAEVACRIAVKLTPAACLAAAYGHWGGLTGIATIGLKPNESFVSSSQVMHVAETLQPVLARTLLAAASNASGNSPVYPEYALLPRVTPEYYINATFAESLFTGKGHGFSCPLPDNSASGEPCVELLLEVVEGAKPLSLFPLPKHILGRVADYLFTYTANGFQALVTHETTALSAARPAWIKVDVDSMLFHNDDPFFRFLGGQRDAAYVDSSMTADEAYKKDSTFSTIRTGVDDITATYMYTGFEGHSPYLPSRHADPNNGVWCDFNLTVEGHDDTQFAPGKQDFWGYKYSFDKSSRITVWVTELERPVDFLFYSDTKVKDVPALRFTIAEDFYIPDVRLNQTQYGMLNLTCPKQAPVFASLPRFYRAKDLPEAWKPEGLLNCTEADCLTFLDAEQVSGATIRGIKRLQVNLFIDNGLAGVPKLMHPLFFDNEHAELTDKDANKYKENVVVAFELAKGGKIGGFVSAGLCLVGAFFAWRTHKKRMNAYANSRYDLVN